VDAILKMKLHSDVTGDIIQALQAPASNQRNGGKVDSAPTFPGSIRADYSSGHDSVGVRASRQPNFFNPRNLCKGFDAVEITPDHGCGWVVLKPKVPSSVAIQIKVGGTETGRIQRERIGVVFPVTNNNCSSC
jgi:hypothetical protein